jgi:cytochrome c oxidase subunit 2
MAGGTVLSFDNRASGEHAPGHRGVGRPPLRSHEEGRDYSDRNRRAVLVALALPAVLLLSGCSKTVQYGFLPTPDKNTTNQTARIMDLWNGSWIAALCVGVLVWGLIIWCIVAYRRRSADAPMPPQVRYNIPLEILYTVLPIMMIGVLFAFTAQDQSAIADTTAKPDVTVNVVGKQWSWDFNYLDSNVYEVGLQGQLDGTPKVEAQLPTLYLPVNKRVEFVLTSRDVIHSFWVPAFLYKMDVIPGVENRFQVVPQREGAYKGKCTELCGEYHSEMLFNVSVVSQQEYEQHMADLKNQGHVGRLDSNLGRAKTPPGGYVPFNSAAATQATGSNS